MVESFKGFKSYDDKLVLVTGSASGIGREIALAFAKSGARLICCDRNEVGLAETASSIQALGRKVLCQRVDVSSRSEMESFSKKVAHECGTLDVLVNNAGISLMGGSLDMSLEDWDEVLGSNLKSVILTCHFFIPPMLKRAQGGQVVNVASASAFASFAGSVAYSTAKFGVLGFSEGLREELRPHGIGVTTVCPGMVKTSVLKNALFRGMDAAPEVRARFENQLAKSGASPAKVAEKIMRATQRNAALVTIGPDAQIMHLLKRISPSLTALIGRKLTEKLEGKRTGVINQERGST